MAEFTEYPDRDALMLSLAREMASQLRRALDVNDRATLSVPGGTTPGPVFDILCGLDLDWSRVDVLLNDERWVGEDSERSNTALLRARLLTDRAAAATLVPLFSGDATPEEGLPKLQAGVEAALPISVLLLGMGVDMHTASLFPGADKLTEALSSDAPPLMALRAPGAPEPRISLTAPVLRDATHAHVLIVGEEKRIAYKAAQAAATAEAAPVRVVLDRATVHWAA